MINFCLGVNQSVENRIKLDKLLNSLEYDSMNPVSILIHFGVPSDAKLFDEIMENLQKRRIIQKRDILIFDRRYYSYKN